MGRDGSDSDYLRENGYDFLVKGEVPSSWDVERDDCVNTSETTHFKTFHEANNWAKNNPGKSFIRAQIGRASCRERV